MHQALVIDEIVQVVFDFCLDFGSDTLTRVARTCKAWRDPALDRLWYRLIDVTPLLQLVPGIIRVNGVYVFESPVSPDLSSLRFYAPRVKHIVHRRNLQLHPHMSSIIAGSVDGMFTGLTTVQLALLNCHSVCPILGPGTMLKKLDLDLSFHPGVFDSSNKTTCDYLSNLPRLETLSLRGLASENLNRTISVTSHLQSISLRLSTSLNADTIIAISRFPALVELEFHAPHIRVADLAEKWSSVGSGVCFPSLRSLNIRASTSLVGELLQNMHSIKLHTIYLDVEPVAQTDEAWIDLFNIMKDKTPNLHDFTIDHHVDTDTPGSDSDTGLPINDLGNDHPISHSNGFENLLRFQLIYPLFALRKLQRIVFDTTPPILVHDEDLEKLGSQLPQLTHLDLGAVPTVDPRWVPKATLKGLYLFSQKSSNLKDLIIPIDLSTSSRPDELLKTFTTTHDTLRNINISTLTPPDPTSMARFLASLFPCLEHADGVADHFDEWQHIQTSIRGIKGASES
ncbi:hypothetical protein E1B28_007299 [Marasmius oreades]|uniref:F-box domain-containing protein n=1 Tax=Marasmius oreades TaxID=181124 RepID=A0A9P7UTW3_9AGAR|nr:uncharacterized protein E1B28_007299 [Marasmius oreades]KAG7093635.1 hypothetical protein E1B28_007299 [Marasmius oreades]